MDELIESVDGSVCRLVLNRPEAGNALSASLVARLHDAVERHAQTGIRRLVLEGAGKHFCTGFDLSSLDAETDDSLLARFVRIELLLQAIHAAPFHTTALAQGRAMGAGADLFATCRQRVIKADASFAFPGARGFGLVLGTRRLAALVGAGVAQDWIDSGRVVDADEALSRRLATRRCMTENEWNDATQDAACADTVTQQALRQALHGAGADEQDLGLLARSAARCGLKKRIESYVQAIRSGRG